MEDDLLSTIFPNLDYTMKVMLKVFFIAAIIFVVVRFLIEIILIQGEENSIGISYEFLITQILAILLGLGIGFIYTLTKIRGRIGKFFDSVFGYIILFAFFLGMILDAPAPYLLSGMGMTYIVAYIIYLKYTKPIKAKKENATAQIR